MASTSKDERLRRGLRWVKGNEEVTSTTDSSVSTESISTDTKQASAAAAVGRKPVVPKFRDDVNRNKSEFERIMGISKWNPVIPIGMGATVCALAGGIWQMYKGNSIKQQWYMRARVGAQAFTVASMVLTVVAVAAFYPAPTPKDWYKQQ